MNNQFNYSNNKDNEDARTPKVLNPGEQARQGDVLLIPKGLITGAISADNAPERPVIAYGEVTGHKHQFQPDKVESRNLIATAAGSAVLIELKNGAVLRHEEHHPIAVPPDSFIIDVQQEYDYETELFRQVAD